ncbi:Pr6Pr family membrane protein [Clavibacter michiganensis]|uniref:Pr6Pr family membrane protein n=1 Tax=Clavibacter michiganensis TaxID=28447 RepID=UPI0026DDA83F|nr:Pr6Pr family membrane protein [Clavibacter michiganensis]MDO4074610.1 Pr6Pr family membrane protein [Clavibacter michiganensis]
MQRILGGVRLVAAIVVVVALIGDFDYVQGFTTFAAENWFSYFTTQSGMAGVVVLAASGLQAIRGRAEPPLMAAVRAVVLSYVVVSGVVFGLIVLESSSQAYYVEVPWSSRLLHFVIPAYALLDWTLAPGRPRVTWKAVGWAMPFPVAWCAFTELRGPRVGWYPYFFLDPAQVGVPFEIAAWLALVAGVLAGVSAFVVALSRVRPADGGRRGRRRGDDAEVDEVTVADAPARASTDASTDASASTPRETAAAER